MNFLISAGGVIVGGLITWFVAHRYYERASKKLRKEAFELKKLTNIIISALVNAKMAKVVRDEQGNISGLHVDVTPESALHLQSVVEGKLHKKKK